MQVRKMASSRRNVYLVKIGEKPAGDGSQEICKDKESNLGPVAGYIKAEIIRGKLYFCFACIFPKVTIRVSDYILCRASMNITIA